jgi:hypothetical protein
MRTNTGLRIGAAAATATSAIALLAVLPAGASAAFDAGFSSACQGDTTIAGRGASFQRSAHLAWGASSFPTNPATATATGIGYASSAAGGCSLFKLSADGGSAAISLDPQGSGEGRGAMGATLVSNAAGSPGVRNTNFQFGVADEPPKAAEIKAANNGPDGVAGTADDGVLYTFPVLQGAVSVIVQLPNGCAVANTAAAHQISRAALEGAFAGAAGFTQWGQILPSITGTGCATKSFKRVVRQDSSGTTYGLKNYLRDIKSSDFPTTLANTEWPADTGTTAVVRPASAGGGALVQSLKAQTTDGGIGYVDLATARSNGFATDTGTAGDTDQTIWLNVERKGGGSYKSPALDDAQGTTNTGANCVNVAYSDVTTGALPAVKDSWYDVTGSSAADYPICILSYAMVWEDLAKASIGHAAGSPDYTQGQARAVKDYFGYVLNSAGGQAALPLAGFQGLPGNSGGTAQAGSVLAVSRAAQQALTWNKQTVVDPGPGGGGGGGTTTTPTTTTPTTTTPTTTTPVTTTPVKPSTPTVVKPKVSVSKAAAVKGRKVTLSVSPSAAGKVSVSATTGSGKKKVTVLSGSATAKKAGALKITLKPTSKGKKALKSGKKAKIAFKVTYTNADGSKTSVTKTISVKIKG